MKKTRKQWKWWMVLLWAWSTLSMIFMFLITSFVKPSNHTPPPDQSVFFLTGIILFLPVLIFLLIQGIKNFREN